MEGARPTADDVAKALKQMRDLDFERRDRYGLRQKGADCNGIYGSAGILREIDVRSAEK
jgi:hypothetical protein